MAHISTGEDRPTGEGRGRAPYPCKPATISAIAGERSE